MKIMLKDVRLAFFDGYTAVPFEDGATPKFGVTGLVPKGSTLDKEVEAVIKQVATEAWGAKAEMMLKSFRGNPNKFAYIDGDTRTYDGFAGHFGLSSKNAKRPTLLLPDKTPSTLEDSRFYSGCYGNISVDIWAQKKDYPGIRATFLAAQFVRDGDAFTPGAIADPDEFEDLSQTGEESVA